MFFKAGQHTNKQLGAPVFLLSAWSKHWSVLVTVILQENFSVFNIVSLFFGVFKQPVENTFPEHEYFFFFSSTLLFSVG